MKKVPHDIVNDFAPVEPRVPVVVPADGASGRSREVGEGVDRASRKAQPNKLNFGSGGVGSTAHLSGELFKMTTGVQMVHVPYKGVGIALIDLVGGQIDLMFPAIPSGLRHHRRGACGAWA